VLEQHRERSETFLKALVDRSPAPGNQEPVHTTKR
jgi:hypothetical protein